MEGSHDYCGQGDLKVWQMSLGGTEQLENLSVGKMC